MEFLGDNTRFGAARVELGEERYVEPLVADGDAFPFGVDGLLPVATSRKKKGGVKTVYAFPFGEGEPPADNDLARELCAAVDFVNVLLGEASELSGHEFGSIGALWLGVPEKGYSFTRVEAVPPANPGDAPIRLRIETSEVPGAPDTLSAVLEYDEGGYLRHALMTEFGENGYSCRVTASVDFASGEVLVQKVAEVVAGEEPYELYYRNYNDWEPRGPRR